MFPRSDGRMGAAACEKQLEEEEEDIGCPSESETSAMDPFSSSSEELDDDATSSSSGSTDNFEMSSLMSQLPLKYVLGHLGVPCDRTNTVFLHKRFVRSR